MIYTKRWKETTIREMKDNTRWGKMGKYCTWGWKKGEDTAKQKCE